MDASYPECYYFITSRMANSVHEFPEIHSINQAAELTGVSGKTELGEGCSSPTCLAPALPDFWFL